MTDAIQTVRNAIRLVLIVLCAVALPFLLTLFVLMGGTTP